MRHGRDPQLRLDCPPIEAVPLNTNCRDEIIPILRALQAIFRRRYRCTFTKLLDLVGRDVNGTSNRKHGRTGLAYWTITVLAGSASWIATLDYDKLQDLAEQHRSLRVMMGLGEWQTPGGRFLIGGGFATMCVCYAQKR